MSRRLITSDKSVPAEGQHEHPCSDCPFSRESLPGWLGGSTAEEWMRDVFGEGFFLCHVLEGAECAGAAIFQANNGKRPRNPDQLHLPKDTVHVFADRDEFMEHHNALRPT